MADKIGLGLLIAVIISLTTPAMALAPYQNREIPEGLVMIQENSVMAIPTLDYYEVSAVITMYNNVWWQTDNDPDIAADGSRVREGIAACPSMLGFGTRIEVNEKVYICADRMAERYRNDWRFDLFSFSLEEARKFGRQEAVVKIYC